MLKVYMENQLSQNEEEMEYYEEAINRMALQLDESINENELIKSQLDTVQIQRDELASVSATYCVDIERLQMVSQVLKEDFETEKLQSQVYFLFQLHA